MPVPFKFDATYLDFKLLNLSHPRPLFHLFLVFFKQALQFLHQINVKIYI